MGYKGAGVRGETDYQFPRSKNCLMTILLVVEGLMNLSKGETDHLFIVRRIISG
jgi:hypothetical protein